MSTVLKLRKSLSGPKKIPKLFGTDGIRGISNEYPMLPEIALKVGQGIVHCLLTKVDRGPKVRPRILIGKDTRLANYMIEQALSAGLCSAGADVLLVGPMPTPAISYLVKSMRVDAGVVITASHNPHEYTGIKIFGSDGDKIDEHDEIAIESFVADAHDKKLSRTQIGKAQRVDDASGRYIVQLKNYFPEGLTLDGMRIALDCAHGAAYKVGPKVFEELGAEVVCAGINPKGENINEKVGAMHPASISRLVKKYRANIGISLDGDGDRLLLCDEKGQVLDGNVLLGILALAFQKAGHLNHSTVVSTITCNSGLKASLGQSSINLVEVPVGDRNVFLELKNKNYSLGGEPSGHIITPFTGSTGDGLGIALKFLEIICREKKSVTNLGGAISLYPSISESIRIKAKIPIEEMRSLQLLLKEAKLASGGQGKLTVRYSGTEPLIRIYIDGPSQSQNESLYQDVLVALQKDGTMS